jgi:arylformamidase
MKQIIYLSHVYTKSFPTYGVPETSLEIEALKSLSCGDSCHTYSFKMQNHWGTHIDSPNHFFAEGKSIHEYPAHFWEYSTPQIINVDVSRDLIIRVDQIRGKVNSDTDILFLKSGFTNLRSKDCYSLENPGVHSEVGFYLRKNYPNLKVIALDFISISSRTNRLEGRKSHQAFLDPNGEGYPILIIEDVKLETEINSLFSVTVLPLMIEGVDSTPCTIIAKLHGAK